MRIDERAPRQMVRPLAGAALAAALLMAGAVQGLGQAVASPVIDGAQQGRVVIMRPTEALEVLAMARELNRRCGFLPEASDELGGYAARAEIAAAAQEGAEAARTALEVAKEEAAGMACDGDARDLVTAALEAAREAARQAGIAVGRGAPAAAPASQPRQRVADRSESRKVRQAKDRSRKVGKVGERRTKRASGKDRTGRTGHAVHKAAASAKVHRLAQRYERLAGTYYLDLRCRKLPYAHARRLWQQVKTLHYRLLKEGGASVLLTAKRRAQAMASRRACESLRLAGR